MMHANRLLSMELADRQSAFLWGPRKTGKSSFLRAWFPESVRLDLLQTDLMLELIRRPALLRERLQALPPAQPLHPVILDEVQKVPQLMDEIHWLIENTDLRFVLCGSSARKLKRSETNLLGGRAWRYEMFPLVSTEVPELDLLQALNRGLLPAHYLQANYRRSLRAYLQDYLKEEVFARALTGRTVREERGEDFGRAFEHFILMEILAHRSYKELHYDVNFWRTASGLEVDFILGGGEVAVEVKGASRVDGPEFRGLRAFAEENHPRRAIVVCNEPQPRMHAGIEVLPWREFLSRLWSGDVLT